MANLGFREALFGTALVLSCSPVESEGNTPIPRASTPNEYRACERRAQLSRNQMVFLLLALGKFDERAADLVAERSEAACLMELRADPEQ